MNGSDPVAEQFAANLWDARKRVGISQEELGFRSDLHRTEIGLLERGRRVPRIDTLVKLAASLSVPPETLLAEIAWQPATTMAGRFSPSADPEQAP
jgi:transcriptional regulator with XRE-family HTH domain